MSGYAELTVSSNFSFLRGASHPEEYAVQGTILGLAGIGITDRNSVAGVVRAHSVAKENGLRLAVGTRLVFADGTPDIFAYPTGLDTWSRLTRLLSIGKQRAPKGECFLGYTDLLEVGVGLNLILCPSDLFHVEETLLLLERLKKISRVRLAARMLCRGDDSRRLERLVSLGNAARVPLIAINDVLYHLPERRPLQDVITCIREHTTLDRAGRLLEANAERHLKPAEEMMRQFRRCPQAVAETLRFLDECHFSLDELRPSYPLENRKGFTSSQDALIAFTEEGAKTRYPLGVPPKIRQSLDHELKLIGDLNYAPYFLTVHDIVCFARGKEILCQGRGSAANSAVCFCLHVTEVDPMSSELLFERFISVERNEPPDIDIDFEHERREEVIQYIYERYGRERAALTATTICYRGRSAIRDVGKVFGLSEDTVATLARTLWGWSSSGVSHEQVRECGLDPTDPRLAKALSLARELIDFPRHLSQHVGGFVITEGRLDEIVPIENATMKGRTVIEWNKDDIEVLGILKVDVLGLGMLSCIRRALDLMRGAYGIDYPRISKIPTEEKDIYAMLSRADSIGVFQVESRAQMSMLPRLRPQKFYDLIIEVAIVRPGPIQGDMVHPYLRRREGTEDVFYPSPSPEYGSENELRNVLEKTLGIPLFQEQAMKIAIVAAGFEPAEADRLRRAMATFRRVGTIQNFRVRFIENMTTRGYPRIFAENCFHQIEGFGEYGFPESHAASFALLVYASGWIKCRYPDVFAAALLNSQPMGFYSSAQIVRDAEEHGVEIRPPDINHSDWDCSLEHGSGLRGLHSRHSEMKTHIRTTHALRLGLRQIEGFSQEDAKDITEVRAQGFSSIRDFWLRTKLAPATMRRLAQADAFASLRISRRQALWAVRGLRRIVDKDDLPLFARASMPPSEPHIALPVMTLGQEVIEDYRSLHLSLKAHPVSFLRDELDRQGIVSAHAMVDGSSEQCITVAGLVLVRQRPGSAESVFMTLEDETGIANIIVWARVFETFRPIVMSARLVGVTGKVQKKSGVTHLVANYLTDLTPMLRTLGAEPRDAFMPTASVSALMPKGRNFH